MPTMTEKKDAKGGKAAASPDDIMKPADMRAILAQAKRGNPASCAIALTKDKDGVILLDKRKKPKKLAVELKKTAGGIGLELDTTSLRFGRAVVDADTDATLLTLTLNKDAPSAMRPRLLENIKKAGFAKLEITVDAALEAQSEEDAPAAASPGVAAPSDDADGPTASDAESVPAPASTTEPQPADQVAERQAEPGPDLQRLAKTLTDLVRQMIAAIAQNPDAKFKLMELATAAQTSLKRGDPQRTMAGIEALRDAVAKASSGAGAAGPAARPQAPTSSPAIAKARQA